MSNKKGKPIFRSQVADYLNTATTGEADYGLMNIFESIDESPGAQTTERFYTSDEASSTITTSYKPQFPITMDMYRENAVAEFIRDIAEEEKLGVEADFVRVRLYQPVTGKDDTYYARKFRVGFEISTISGEGGAIMSVEGNMNVIGDMVIGEFNVATRTFTAASAAVQQAVGG